MIKDKLDETAEVAESAVLQASLSAKIALTLAMTFLLESPAGIYHKYSVEKCSVCQQLPYH